MRIIIDKKLDENIPTLHIYSESGTEKKPVLFILHGHNSRKENNIELAYEYAQNGMYVILFDAAHHGELITEEYGSLSSLQRDCMLVPIMVETAEFIKKLIECNVHNAFIDIERIALYGFSMGGNIIFYYLSNLLSDYVKAAVCFISTPAWGNGIKKYLKKTPEATQYIDQQQIKQIYQIQPFKNYKKIKDFPLLMILGEKDEIVPVGDVKIYYHRLYRNYSDKNKVRLEIFEHAKHYVTAEGMQLASEWLHEHI